MTRHYATVCRDWQLPVLFGSMLRHCQPFVLHVLAWDWDMSAFEGRRRTLARVHPETRIVTTWRKDFLERHPELEPAALPGPRRSPIDTVATVRWQFFADIMEGTGLPLTQLDGDTWFWSTPEPMFDEIGDARMAVSPHRIPSASACLPGVTFESHGKYGIYNSGLVYFRDPGPARELARLNRGWSYTELRELADGRVVFGDQGWLQQVAHHLRAHVISHPGANLAPWNVHRYGIVPGEPPLVDLYPLILFHYSGFQIDEQREVTRWADAGYALTGEQIRVFYAPYADAVRRG
jgi:hypothetical protein